jgi:hypothetical protein
VRSKSIHRQVVRHSAELPYKREPSACIFSLAHRNSTAPDIPSQSQILPRVPLHIHTTPTTLNKQGAGSGVKSSTFFLTVCYIGYGKS